MPASAPRLAHFSPLAGRASATRRLLPVALALLLCAGFLALGTWQVERRAWKLDLIARVDARLKQPALPAPAPAAWPALSPTLAEYLPVQVTGNFIAGHDTLVQAATERGAGHWVLTPLRTASGWTVLVNRGFVPTPRGWIEAPAGPTADEAPTAAAAASRSVSAVRPPPHAAVTVSGLLRMSEPGGAFLRSNAPAEGRWYSRDVAAIGASLGLAGDGRLAPYFIDAAAGAPASAPAEGADSAAGAAPIGGMTVVRFHNNHLVYSLTWYALAAMSAWAAWRVGRPWRFGQAG